RENAIPRLALPRQAEQAFQAPDARGRNAHATTSRPVALVTESLRETARRGAREAERKALEAVLERVNWNRAEASRILRVSYKTLLTKIAECALTPPLRRP